LDPRLPLASETKFEQLLEQTKPVYAKAKPAWPARIYKQELSGKGSFLATIKLTKLGAGGVVEGFLLTLCRISLDK